MGSSVSSPRDGSVSTNSEFSSFSSAYKSGPESPPFSNASRSSWNSFAAARMPNSNPKPCSNNDGNGAHGAKVHMIASGWNFTKSMVVSVLPRFLNDKNSSSDSGGHFNKGRTMTSLSGDTIISSGNNISSGYASVTNSSGSSRSSSPLDPFNEEHQPGFNHDTTNVILRSGKPNYPQSPYIKTEMVVAKHISKNTAKRNSSLLEGDKNNNRRSSQMTTGGFVSECRSMVPSFLFPFYNRSAGNTRLPLKSLQNNYLQQRDLSSKSNNKQQVRTLSEIKAILNNNNLSDETDAANNKKDEVKLRKGHAEHGRKPPLPPGLSIESPLAPSRTTTVIQASTSELLRSLGHFLKIQCPLKCFDPSYLAIWFRTIDRALILQGWQEIAFVNPASLVFVYMLIRDHLNAEDNRKNLETVEDVHSCVLVCLYIAYSYMGNEISYPLKPFVADQTDRDRFWSQCVKIIDRNSQSMLKLNSSSSYFLEVFLELKQYSVSC